MCFRFIDISNTVSMTNLGKWRDHNDYFNECRNKLVNEITSETNNLIIRLDKLINHISIDESSKKEFEKSVVPWLADSDFPNCRVCNVKFSLIKRRHHCRLCGKIVCHNCSQFLTYALARKLTGPEIVTGGADDISLAEDADSLSKSGLLEKRSLPILPNDSLHFVRNRTGRFLGSLIGSRESADASSSNGGEESVDRLRICEACKHLLERREQAMDLRTSQFIFVDIYKRLFQLLTEISNLTPTYRHMAESLNCGKTVFSLSSAIELRRKMISIQREIGSLSDRIEKWGLSEEVDDPLITSKPSIREIMLQRHIKTFAVNSLHELMSTLPDLPTQDAYEGLVREYREREQKAQSMSNLSAYGEDRATSPIGASTSAVGGERGKLPSRHDSLCMRTSTSLTALKQHGGGAAQDGWVSSSPFRGGTRADQPTATLAANGGRQRNGSNGSSGGDGTSASSADNPIEELDVIQQQYLNIKSYLLQAAQAGRLEEVEILEQNLLNLESELRRKNLPTPHLAA